MNIFYSDSLEVTAWYVGDCMYGVLMEIEIQVVGSNFEEGIAVYGGAQRGAPADKLQSARCLVCLS